MTEDTLVSRAVEVYVAMWGPVVGMLMAVGIGLAYAAWPNPMLAALAGWVAMLNLFNLMPINPLDGGRVLKSVMYSLNHYLGVLWMAIGVGLSVALTIKLHMGLFAFLAVIGFLDFFVEGVHRTTWYRRHLEDEVRRAEKEWRHRKTVCSNEWRRSGSLGIDPYLSSLVRWEVDACIKSQELRLKLKNLNARPQVAKLTRRDIAISAFSFAGLVAILWSIMNAFSHVPGADMALKMLEG